MAGPPQRVTFFFSDIQGSTRLLEALGSAYAAVLGRHRDIVRECVAARHGAEVGTEGDSFFIVFPEAAEAVDAAIATQRALASETWPAGAAIRVRIGLHTGEAARDGSDYVGLDVHRAARIMAAAHGGQIVISESTRLALGQGADGVELADLGQHRLRDLSAPERLFQVSAAGLETAFPPLRTVDAIPNNLPAQATELVDREAELGTITQLLDTPGVRLVTLVGPGGIGKTRLAVQAAADRIHAFDDGAYFVDLASARDSDALLEALVRCLGVSVSADADPADAIADHLRLRTTLLVLDNFEQLMDAAVQVTEIMARCPQVKVLVTSRENLRLRGERLVPLEPLALPDVAADLTAADAMRWDAVRLFVSRAEEARAGFVLTDPEAPAVAEICSRLDGVPLALELAAASLRLLSPHELRDRLRDELEPIASGPRDLPDRQRTLHSTIEWSYELLSPDERQLYAVISIFSSASMEAVQDVAGALGPHAGVDALATLSALVDKSLVRLEASPTGQRFTMLEIIRRHAGEKLAEAPELADAAAAAHAAYYVRFAAETRERHGPQHGAAVDRLAAELDNLEAAWRYELARADVGQLNRLAEGLWLVHEARGWYHRVVALTNDLLDVLRTARHTPEHADEEVTARLTLARALLAMRGYTDEVERLYQEALDVKHERQAAPRRVAVLRSLGSFYLYRNQIDKTLEIGQKLLAVADETGDTWLELEGHMMVGPAAAFMGDPRKGLGHLQRAMDLFDAEERRSAPFRLGPSPGVAAPLVTAMFRWWLGQPDTAQELVIRGVELADLLRHPYSAAWANFHAGILDIWNGDYAAARRRAERVCQVAEQHDYGIWLALGTVMDGVSQAALEDPQRGLEQTKAGVTMYEGIQTPPVFWPLLLSLKADAYARADRPAEAKAALDDALGLAGTQNWLSAAFLAQKAEVVLAAGRADEAIALLEQAEGEAGAVGSRMIQVRALRRLVELGSGPQADVRRRELAAALADVEEGRDSPDVQAARRLVEDVATPEPA